VIEQGHIYRAKKPKCVLLFLGDYYDDRQVLWMSAEEIQYDSPTIRDGRHYPRVSREKFETWAGEDVTEGYPSEWAKWEKR